MIISRSDTYDNMSAKTSDLHEEESADVPLSSFFSLPAEVRNLIYQYYFLDWAPRFVYRVKATGYKSTQWKIGSGINLSIVRVSRQAHDETKAFLKELPSHLHLRIDCSVMQHYHNFLSFCPPLIRSRVAWLVLCFDSVTMNATKLSAERLRMFPRLSSLRLIYGQTVTCKVEEVPLFSDNQDDINGWYDRQNHGMWLAARFEMLDKCLVDRLAWSKLFQDLNGIKISAAAKVEMVWNAASAQSWSDHSGRYSSTVVVSEHNSLPHSSDCSAICKNKRQDFRANIRQLELAPVGTAQVLFPRRIRLISHTDNIPTRIATTIRRHHFSMGSHEATEWLIDEDLQEYGRPLDPDTIVPI